MQHAIFRATGGGFTKYIITGVRSFSSKLFGYFRFDGAESTVLPAVLGLEACKSKTVLEISGNLRVVRTILWLSDFPAGYTLAISTRLITFSAT